MSSFRRHSIYCDPVIWARIGKRARAAGMTVSAFGMACALQRRDGACLVLTEEEQRRLYVKIDRLDRLSRALLAPDPATGMSVHEALAVLGRLHSEGAGK